MSLVTLVHRHQPYLFVFMGPLPLASDVLGSPRMPQSEGFLGMEMMPVLLRARIASALFRFQPRLTCSPSLPVAHVHLLYHERPLYFSAL
jgi:hypothetical protein